MTTERPLIVDGLQINNWTRETLVEQHEGGVGALSATCAVWEDAIETIRAISDWYRLATDNADLMRLATSVADINEAVAAGQVAVMLNFQNTSPFGDDLGMVEVFHRLGVRVAQLTYNIQNLVGGACYDPVDSGLTGYGEGLVAEMNRLGMLVDLSHVGNRTARDTVDASSKPVAITHANPLWFYDNPRNKPDDVIDAVTEGGGVIGVCLYPRVIDVETTTRDAFCAMIARLVDQVGIDHVGIGSDSTRGWTDDYLSFLRNGRYRRPDPDAPDPSWPKWPSWFQSPADFGNLVEGLAANGFTDDDVASIVGGNWMRLFETTFSPEPGHSTRA